jgi:NAD(P) transhydrogenase subunit alpha
MSLSLVYRGLLVAAGETPAGGIDITPFLQLYVFLLAGFLGYQIITKVPALLHTPLMSATNAISGISLVGSLVAAGATDRGTLSVTLGFIAVVAATINVVGGFMITDRMLKMFKRQERK